MLPVLHKVFYAFIQHEVISIQQGHFHNKFSSLQENFYVVTYPYLLTMSLSTQTLSMRVREEIVLSY